MDNFTAEEAEDYSGVRDPDAFRSFQLAAAYCLTCSEDSSEGDYDPTRECFMAELADGQNDNTPGNDGKGGGGQTRRQIKRWCLSRPFFFVKLGGAAGTVGATQGASSQTRRAASTDTGAAPCDRAAAHRAWRTCPGSGARRPGKDPS